MTDGSTNQRLVRCGGAIDRQAEPDLRSRFGLECWFAVTSNDRSQGCALVTLQFSERCFEATNVTVGQAMPDESIAGLFYQSTFMRWLG